MELHDSVRLFGGKKVLVLGDCMLDQYTFGSITRISPEAPVPVFQRKHDTYVLGGAANVSHNISRLGGSVRMISVTGNDTLRQRLLLMLDEARIDRSGVLVDQSRSTTLKNRIIAGSHQHVIRFDDEHTHAVTAHIEEEVLRIMREHVQWADIVVLSDYAKGFLTERIVSAIKEEAKRRSIKVVADIKPKNKHLYIGVDLVTPNMHEAREIVGGDTVDEIGRRLCEYFKSSVYITRGSDGITACDRSLVVTNVPATCESALDVSGAGDTVLAVAALALASDLSLPDAVRLANIAGGVVVQKQGTATITQDELVENARKIYVPHATSPAIQHLREVCDAIDADHTFQDSIVRIAETIGSAILAGNKILIAGNGGSAAEADHFAAEIVGRYSTERRGYPALALSSSAATVTALGNDYGYDKVYARQVHAHGKPGDVFIGLSTSGNSENIIEALRVAKENGLVTVTLLGRGGGGTVGMADYNITVPAQSTARIQEIHLLIIHTVCGIVDDMLASRGGGGE